MRDVGDVRDCVIFSDRGPDEEEARSQASSRWTKESHKLEGIPQRARAVKAQRCTPFMAPSAGCPSLHTNKYDVRRHQN